MTANKRVSGVIGNTHSLLKADSCNTSQTMHRELRLGKDRAGRKKIEKGTVMIREEKQNRGFGKDDKGMVNGDGGGRDSKGKGRYKGIKEEHEIRGTRIGMKGRGRGALTSTSGISIED